MQQTRTATEPINKLFHIPPNLYDYPAEEKVLGAMLRDREAAQTAINLLTDFDFYHPANGLIFDTLKRFVQKNAAYDLIILTNYLQGMNLLDQIGGPFYLAELAQKVVTTTNIEHHCGIVKEKSRRRIVVRMSRDLEQYAIEEDCIESVISLTQRSMDILRHNYVGDRLSRLVLSAPNLIQQVFPARQDVITPFLSRGSLNMIYGPRGVGKSFFTLEMAVCIATGSDFLGFSVPQARPVLYVDGEMPLAVQQERLHHLAPNRDLSGLGILSYEWIHAHSGASPILNTAEGQIQIEGMIAQYEPKPEVLILDNLSSLCRGDENDNAAQDVLLDWLIRLRHQGLTVVLVHHAGKSGDQRGASRREDPLDTVIRLGKSDTAASKGCSFRLDFTKKRHFSFDQTLACELTQTPEGEWVFLCEKRKSERDCLLQEALQAIAEEQITGTAELAKRLPLKLRAVQNAVRKLRQDGYLDGWTVTEKGRDWLSKEN